MKKMLTGLVLPLLSVVVGCSSPGSPTESSELGELDQSNVLLAENPEVLAIGDLRVRVRVATIASDCAVGFETRVFERDSVMVVEPWDDLPGPCGTRGARINLHEVVITYLERGPRVVVVRALDPDRGVVELEHVVDVV